MRRDLFLAAALAIATPALAGPVTVLFVDEDSTAVTPDGATWATSFPNLRDALDAADASGAVTEIRIADGTYTPDTGASATPGDRAATFTMLEGVDILGGYQGINGPGLPDDRDTDTFITTLSGDLNADDNAFNNQADNAYQVVRANGLASSTLINGVRIIGGNTRGATAPDQFMGAGIQAVGALLSVQDCDFANNFGGAIYAELTNINASGCNFDANTTGVLATDATVVISGSTFENHPAGGVEAMGGDTTITDCDFTANRNAAVEILWGEGVVIGSRFEANVTAGIDGAGIRADLTATNNMVITGCDFLQNTAINNAGGGVYINGGSESSITDCTFIENEARAGGGVHSTRGVVTNCRFERNHANGATIGHGGGANGNRLEFYDCVFLDNTAQRIGGGCFVTNNTNFITPIQRCFFGGNRSFADAGGGLGGNIGYIYGCVFTGNRSFLRGGGAVMSAQCDMDGCLFYGNISDIQSVNGLATDVNSGIRNSVFWFNGGTSLGDQINVTMSEESGVADFGLTYNCIMGLTPDVIGVGNIGTNPLFADPDGPDNILGTEDDDFSVSFGSPLIDAGTNALVADDYGDLDGDFITFEPTPEDFNGAPRFIDDPSVADTGEGTAPIVDIGPLESDGAGPAVCFGDCDGNGTVAFNDLVAMLFEFGMGDAPNACDADGNGTINFNDLVTALFLFGPCP
ncbi:MAG: right-handed parallel beta-helix repeat-containing protein [Phycisphaerales bacterium]